MPVDETTLFRGVSHTTKTLSVFMNEKGRPFLEGVVFPSISAVVECKDDDTALEIDPDRADTTTDVKANTAKLLQIVDHVLSCIFSASNQCPR
jgi:hypothetical protein